VDGDQIVRLLAEREAAARVEWLRLEEEATQIAGLIEQCRRKIERLNITREVLSGLVTGPAEPMSAVPMSAVPMSAVPMSAVPDPAPDGAFADQLLTILAEAGRPLRCREVVAVMGEDPSVARHGERVRHRLKKLVTAGRVSEVEPGLVTLREDSVPSPG
jgi:hypothetical protein